MNILVTGGAGYVGSQLIPALLKSGHSVTVFDTFWFEPRQFGDAHRRLTCYEGDLRDETKLARAIDGAEAVIHLAGMSNDPSGDLNPQLTWDINFEAACRLVDIAQRAGVRLFINASSASVYGVREETRVIEELKPRPQTIYARTKAECESYVLARNAETFVTTSVRPATLCGYAPRMRLDLTVNILTYHAVCRGEIRVFGGDQYRPNLSLPDMVRAYLLLLDADTSTIAGRTFNLCERNYTVIEIAEKVRQVLGLEDIEIKRIPTEDNRSYRLCADRAEKELRFFAETSLETSIREVASALKDGRIIQPEHIRYRNVEWLRGLNWDDKKWPHASL